MSGLIYYSESRGTKRLEAQWLCGEKSVGLHLAWHKDVGEGKKQSDVDDVKTFKQKQQWAILLGWDMNVLYGTVAGQWTKVAV
jgi:hypothetical protein